MAKSHLAVILALGLVAGGCANSGQNSAQKAAEQATLDAQDDSACRLSGASPGTHQYSGCRARLGETRAVTNTKMNDQEMRYRNSEALMQAGVPPTNRR